MTENRDSSTKIDGAVTESTISSGDFHGPVTYNKTYNITNYGQQQQVAEKASENERPPKPSTYRGEKPFFVGRNEDIDTVKECLKVPGSRISIVGLGGTGKSALAFKAIHESEDIFDVIIPIYFESVSKLIEFLSKIGQALKLPMEELAKLDTPLVEDKLIDTLGNKGHPLIFADNYENISGVLKSNSPPPDDIIRINAFMNRAPSNTSILLTSRQRKNLFKEKRIDLEGLSIEEGRKFFAKVTGDEYLENASKGIQIAIEKVVEKTGGHPLTIEILAQAYQGLGKEELEEMAKNIDVKTTNPWEPEERLKSLKASFDYSMTQLENKLRKLLPKMTIFKSPFPISAISSVLSTEKVDVMSLYNRSWLTRIDSDEYGKLEQENWLYKFHPAVKNYLEDELKKIDGIDLEHEYGDKFSRYYYNRLSETYDSLSRETTNSPYVRHFNIIVEGTYNDFDRSITLQKNLEEKVNISKLIGDLLYTQGRGGEAIKYYDIALEINPNHIDAWYWKGQAFKGLHRYEGAIECFNKILEKNNNDIERRIEKIECLSYLGRNVEALECYNTTLPLLDDAINREPQKTIAWQNKGRALDYIGREEEALECYNRALEINPDRSASIE